MPGAGGTPPDDVAGLHAEALRRLRRGEFEAVEPLCQAILARSPEHADARFLLGMATLARGRTGAALPLVAQAVAACPDRAEYHAQYARILALLGRRPEAVAAAERALALDPPDALTCDTAGVALARAGEHARAVPAFRRAVALRPAEAGHQFNLAASLQFTGDFDGAEAAWEAAIAAEPRNYRAHHALAHLRRQTTERNHVARLEALLPAVAADAEGHLLLRHALAKECEDLGDHAQAFAHLLAGKAPHVGRAHAAVARNRVLFDALARSFDREWLAQVVAGCDSPEPIFIVGMPRTGTTLTERILTNHPHVHSAGELQNFGLCVKRATATPGRALLDPETVARAVDLDARALGEAYVASTRPFTGHTPRFVDKMPLNFLYAGLIHRALPRARIVCLRRHPVDTCLSNFRQLFAVGQSYYDYAYDLLDTGRYWLLFERLLRHWREALPGRVLELHYEALVADPEAQARRLVAHCGLDWHPGCLDFQRNAQPVATASSVQVRRPLYSDAIGRWRRYGRELDPLVTLLRGEGVAVD